MLRSSLSLTVFAAGILTACSTSSPTETTSPILDAQGNVGPQRNLLVSDLSIGTIGNVRAVDETFDTLVSTYSVAADPNGSTGLVRGETAVEGFGSGNSLTFIANGNRFIFDIDTEAGGLSQEIQNILLADPTVFPDSQSGNLAALYASSPDFFTGVFNAFGQAALPAGLSVGEYVSLFDTLAESASEAEQDFYSALQNRTAELVGVDQYFYFFPTGQYEATNTNGTSRTDTVAIGAFQQVQADGSTTIGHLVFGHRTPLSEMPTTGSTTYTGKIAGDVLTNNSLRSLTGSNELTVNFETGLLDISISTIIREGGGQDGGTTFLPYKDFTGTGLVSDTVFDGEIFEVDGDAEGTFQGGFFGPVANEVGGTFTFGDDSSYGSAGFTGSQDDDSND